MKRSEKARRNKGIKNVARKVGEKKKKREMMREKKEKK
jgi:hypothetical protein